MKINDKKLSEIIKKGSIGVLPTDTLLGLVGSAFSHKTIEEIYKIKGRKVQKPFIVLISSTKDLEKFGIKLDEISRKFLSQNWPGKVSVVLDCPNKKFQYLHRGTKTLAFRLPRKKGLADLIEKTGPLVAPSANPEGKKPAQNITEAKKYFGDSIDFYVSGRIRNNLPSTLVEIKKGKIKILRKGAGRIK